MSDIKLAIKTGQRPTAIILRDKYAGYRDYRNEEWECQHSREVDHTSWTEWDMALAAVCQIIEDYTNKDNGQLYWIDSSDKVTWDVKSSFSGYDAAIESARETHNFQPGESLYAMPVYDESAPPTLAEWVESVTQDSVRPPGYLNAGHDENSIIDAREEALFRRQEIEEMLRASL